MAFIFLLSAQTATESSGLSLHISKCVAEKAVDILPYEYTSGGSVHDIALLIQPIIRKVAHFVEFAILGVLLLLWARCWAFRRAGLLAIGLGALYAGGWVTSVMGPGERWTVEWCSSGFFRCCFWNRTFYAYAKHAEIFQKSGNVDGLLPALRGGGANQARQPLLLEELDTPVIEIPDLSKSTVKTISFSWPAQGPESSAFGCESTLFLPNCVRIRVLTSQIPWSRQYWLLLREKSLSSMSRIQGMACR